MSRRGSRSTEFQLKDSSRYKKIEQKPAEANAWGIGHGGQEVGRKTSSRRVKIECALSGI
jgi:hypothetical protein